MDNQEDNALKQGLATIRLAIQLDGKCEYEEALNMYHQGAEKLFLALKMTNVDSRQKLYRAKITEYLGRAEKIQAHLKPKKAAEKAEDGSNGGGKPGMVGANGKAKSGDDVDEENRKLRNMLSGSILQDRPNVRWEDVAGLELAKEALKEAVILPIKFPSLFRGKRQTWKGILLYGPPGTGKSFLAKAVATQANSTFFSVSSSNLVSKWLGESEKLVRQLFTMARENKPSVIFIDEIDALCGPRGEGESEASRRIKTEILVQMDGVGNDSKGVLVLAATNIPWQLDAAIRRRFQRRIHIGLPDALARARMFKLAIGDFSTGLTAADYNALAEMSEGFSGSDISAVVQEALMRPVRKLNHATHFKKVNVDNAVKLTPCSPGDPEAIEMTWDDVGSDELLEPPLGLRDFTLALTKMSVSTSAKDVEKQLEWTKEFGSEGA